MGVVVVDGGMDGVTNAYGDFRIGGAQCCTTQFAKKAENKLVVGSGPGFPAVVMKCLQLSCLHPFVRRTFAIRWNPSILFFFVIPAPFRILVFLFSVS